VKVESLLATEESYAALIVKVREENAGLHSQIQYISAEHDSFKYTPVFKARGLVYHSPDFFITQQTFVSLNRLLYHSTE